MRRFLTWLVLILALLGCQSPFVKVRNLSYEGRVEVNDEKYDFNIQYGCHYEDVSWISERGAAWHNRAGSGLIKVIGKLSGGSRYEILPVRPWAGYGETCADITESVTTRLFIELPNGRVESFDKSGSRSASFKVSALESRFVFNGNTVAAYEPQENWARNKSGNTPATVRYYTVWLTEYAKENWEDRLGSGIREFIEARKIPRFESGRSYPFSAWSDDDVKFAREHRGALRWPKSHILLAPSSDTEEIWTPAKSTAAVLWLIEPIPLNETEKWRGAMMNKFKRWIEFKGSRIEVPLKDYYRLFYDKERDRILQFRVEHVDLW